MIRKVIIKHLTNNAATLRLKQEVNTKNINSKESTSDTGCVEELEEPVTTADPYLGSWVSG